MSSSHGGDGNQDEQEVPECPYGDKHDEEESKESPSGANEQKDKDEDETVWLARCMPATEIPLSIKEMEEMLLRLGLS